MIILLPIFLWCLVLCLSPSNGNARATSGAYTLIPFHWNEKFKTIKAFFLSYVGSFITEVCCLVLFVQQWWKATSLKFIKPWICNLYSTLLKFSSMSVKWVRLLLVLIALKLKWSSWLFKAAVCLINKWNNCTRLLIFQCRHRKFKESEKNAYNILWRLLVLLAVKYGSH